MEMDVIQNYLVIVDTFTQEDNYYSIAYFRLDEFELNGFQSYHYRREMGTIHCFEAYFRLATDKEFKEVKRVISVMLKRLTLVGKL